MPPTRHVRAALAVTFAVLALDAAEAQRSTPQPSRSQPQPAPAAGEPVLAPHRAIYEFTLATARSGKSIASLSGRMVYEFTGSNCDGFTQSMRFVTHTASQDGETTTSDQRSTSWEPLDGSRYRFQTSQYRNEKLADQTAGTAVRGEGAADTAVNLTHPDTRKTAIGGAALFPVQHSIKLLEAARQGLGSFRSDFYDGSDGGEKSYVVNALIGRPVAATYNRSLPRVGHAARLDGMPAWPVALSYYEHGAEAKDAVPMYEMSFLYFQNGVSRRLVIDNGEYAMKGELKDLVMIDPTPCKK